MTQNTVIRTPLSLNMLDSDQKSVRGYRTAVKALELLVCGSWGHSRTDNVIMRTTRVKMLVNRSILGSHPAKYMFYGILLYIEERRRLWKKYASSQRCIARDYFLHLNSFCGILMP